MRSISGFDRDHTAALGAAARRAGTLAQGYGLHQIKEWMGHSTIVVTIDLYERLAPEDTAARQAADDAAYLSATPKAPVRQLRAAAAP